MSQTPVVTPKPKYNKKSPWRWVDSQLENFMNEQKEMRKYISNIEDELSHTTQELDGIYQLVDTTPNNMELGKMVRTYYFENTEEEGEMGMEMDIGTEGQIPLDQVNTQENLVNRPPIQ